MSRNNDDEKQRLKLRLERSKRWRISSSRIGHAEADTERGGTSDSSTDDDALEEDAEQLLRVIEERADREVSKVQNDRKLILAKLKPSSNSEFPGISRTWWRCTCAGIGTTAGLAIVVSSVSLLLSSLQEHRGKFQPSMLTFFALLLVASLLIMVSGRELLQVYQRGKCPCQAYSEEKYQESEDSELLEAMSRAVKVATDGEWQPSPRSSSVMPR